MKNIKKIVVIFIIGLLFASCAVQKPIYKKGTDKDKYNEKLVKYYESKHK